MGGRSPDLDSAPFSRNLLRPLVRDLDDRRAPAEIVFFDVRAVYRPAITGAAPRRLEVERE